MSEDIRPGATAIVRDSMGNRVEVNLAQPHPRFMVDKAKLAQPTPSKGATNRRHVRDDDPPPEAA